MNRNLIDLLQLKTNYPRLTQRELSDKLGMSLGKTNHVLNQLKQTGVVDEQFSLTNAGQDYVSTHHPQQAVILAAGFGMRMVPINTEEPKGLLEVNQEPLIERLIKQLQARDIQTIYIVVGFMKEHYEYLIDKYNVKLIVNPYYHEWNNIYSLYLAKDHLTNSYVVPCDIWFRDNPFSKVEDLPWYMFSNQQNAVSQWRITNRGTIKHVNRDGNRMVGLAYLDESAGDRVKQELTNRVTHHLRLDEFWESLLIHGDHFALSSYLIKDQQFAEINSYEELRDLDSNSNHLKNDAIQAVVDTLGVQDTDIHNIRVLKKGMTNRSFIFDCRNHQYIMRIPGAGTKELINRRHEYDVYQAIKNLPYVEQTLYLNPENGYKLTKFIQHSHNCDPNNWEEVKRSMQLLHKMHASHLKVDHTFDLQAQVNMYEGLRKTASAYRDYPEVKQRINQLLSYVDKLDKDWTLCHIDANADNFVFDQNENVFLIDWEYAGMQDPDVDVAMFAIYSMYNAEQIDRLIDIYCDYSSDEQRKAKIYAYIAICGLLWSNWCEYKQSLGLDFGEYSLAQYRYAKEYSKKVLKYLKG